MIVLSLRSGIELKNRCYRIQRTLGRGGFGFVYSATDKAGVEYAIKEAFDQNYVERDKDGKTIIPVTSEKNAERIHRHQCERAKDEYAMFQSSELKHPSLVPLVDVFDENNTTYLVMPLVRGETLTQFVQKNAYQFEVKWVLRILKDIGNVLTLLHRAKLIHRDLKPDNILITKDSNGDFVPVVLDTGATRTFNMKGGVLTGISTDFGAPEIVGPEYAKLYGTPGPGSDCFALAGIAYSLLTGARPMDWTARSARLVLTKCDPLTQPEELNPIIWNVLRKSLSLHVEQRHSSVTTFLNELLIAFYRLEKTDNNESHKNENITASAETTTHESPVKPTECTNSSRNRKRLNGKKAPQSRTSGILAFLLVMIALLALNLIVEAELVLMFSLIFLCLHMLICWYLIEKNVPPKIAIIPIVNLLSLIDKK